jgi:hypothetical protein
MPTPARSLRPVPTAAIALTIEELRRSISTKFSDSRKNPINLNLREQIDACVLVHLTIPASREHHRLEAEIADGGAIRPASSRSRKPTTTNCRSR